MERRDEKKGKAVPSQGFVKDYAGRRAEVEAPAPERCRRDGRFPNRSASLWRKGKTGIGDRPPESGFRLPRRVSDRVFAGHPFPPVSNAGRLAENPAFRPDVTHSPVLKSNPPTLPVFRGICGPTQTTLNVTATATRLPGSGGQPSLRKAGSLPRPAPARSFFQLRKGWKHFGFPCRKIFTGVFF